MPYDADVVNIGSFRELIYTEVEEAVNKEEKWIEANSKVTEWIDDWCEMVKGEIEALVPEDYTNEGPLPVLDRLTSLFTITPTSSKLKGLRPKREAHSAPVARGKKKVKTPQPQLSNLDWHSLTRHQSMVAAKDDSNRRIGGHPQWRGTAACAFDHVAAFAVHTLLESAHLELDSATLDDVADLRWTADMPGDEPAYQMFTFAQMVRLNPASHKA